MKPFVLLLFSFALQAEAAEPVKSAPDKAAWFSGLQGLKETMNGMKGLGENMANRTVSDASQLKDFSKPFQHLELIKSAAEIRLADR